MCPFLVGSFSLALLPRCYEDRSNQAHLPPTSAVPETIGPCVSAVAELERLRVRALFQVPFKLGVEWNELRSQVKAKLPPADKAPAKAKAAGLSASPTLDPRSSTPVK